MHLPSRSRAEALQMPRNLQAALGKVYQPVWADGGKWHVSDYSASLGEKFFIRQIAGSYPTSESIRNIPVFNQPLSGLSLWEFPLTLQTDCPHWAWVSQRVFKRGRGLWFICCMLTRITGGHLKASSLWNSTIEHMLLQCLHGCTFWHFTTLGWEPWRNTSTETGEQARGRRPVRSGSRK